MYGALNIPESVEHNPSLQTNRNWSMFIYSILVYAFSLSIVILLTYKSSPWNDPKFMTSMSKTSSTLFDTVSIATLHAKNEYGLYSGPYPWLSTSSPLAEPYKETEFWITDTSLSAVDSLKFDWRVQTNQFGDYRKYTGLNVTHVFDSPGFYEVNVSVSDPDGSQISFYEFLVICKCV